MAKQRAAQRLETYRRRPVNLADWLAQAHLRLSWPIEVDGATFVLRHPTLIPADTRAGIEQAIADGDDRRVVELMLDDPAGFIAAGGDTDALSSFAASVMADIDGGDAGEAEGSSIS